MLTDDAFKKDITELFGYFEAEIFDKLYYLTKLNEKRMPKLFLSGLINLSIFLMILIVSLIIYAIKPNNTFAYFSTIILVASFIANTVDLVVILGLALKAELSIKDFYKI